MAARTSARESSSFAEPALVTARSMTFRSCAGNPVAPFDAPARPSQRLGSGALDRRIVRQRELEAGHERGEVMLSRGRGLAGPRAPAPFRLEATR